MMLKPTDITALARARAQYRTLLATKNLEPKLPLGLVGAILHLILCGSISFQKQGAIAYRFSSMFRLHGYKEERCRHFSAVVST